MTKKIISIIFLFWCFSSCSQKPEHQRQLNQKPYFDIIGYFSKEADKLQSQNFPIKKAVSKNNEAEEKMTRLDNWKNEFELFMSSDINKPDWLGSYTIDSSAKKSSYIARSPKLRTKSIEIYKTKNGNVKLIAIRNADSNWLYQSSEKLMYYPDSLYRIEKVQWIRLLGTNTYAVQGIIEK